MRRLITTDNVLFIAFAAGLTAAALAQALNMPDKVFQIVGTFVSFVACFVWTVRS